MRKQVENVKNLWEEMEVTIKAGKGREERVLFLNQLPEREEKRHPTS